MSDSDSATDKSGDTGEGLHGGDKGHASDIPETSPGTESDNSLSAQVSHRPDDEKDDE